MAYPEPIEQALNIDNKSKLKYIFPKNSKKNTEYFKKNYYDAGQFYMSTVKGWNSKMDIQLEKKWLENFFKKTSKKQRVMVRAR